MNDKLNETKQKIKLVNRELNKIQKAKEKLENQLNAQKEKEKQKADKAKARKERNHRIYQWGALVPLVLGQDRFDGVALRSAHKALFCFYIMEFNKKLEEIEAKIGKKIETISYSGLYGTEFQEIIDQGQRRMFEKRRNK
ncbi:MAG: hypothetical protein EKK54_05540 [Neisseriaceae bacterium]|nr:MAG: hypothetical protein EKK54_05540 [Neisseriaceae bacterium]